MFGHAYAMLLACGQQAGSPQAPSGSRIATASVPQATHIGGRKSVGGRRAIGSRRWRYLRLNRTSSVFESRVILDPPRVEPHRPAGVTPNATSAQGAPLGPLVAGPGGRQLGPIARPRASTALQRLHLALGIFRPNGREGGLRRGAAALRHREQQLEQQRQQFGPRHEFREIRSACAGASPPPSP